METFTQGVTAQTTLPPSVTRDHGEVTIVRKPGSSDGVGGVVGCVVGCVVGFVDACVAVGFTGGVTVWCVGFGGVCVCVGGAVGPGPFTVGGAVGSLVATESVGMGT